MSENVKNLTANQEKFLVWLALPKSERHPHTQALFADTLGVNEATLSRWKKDYGLDARAAELAREHVTSHLPDIYGALVREAKKGNYQQIKLTLEVAGHYVERRHNTNESTVNVNRRSDTASEIREIDEHIAQLEAEITREEEEALEAQEGEG